jgi:hypothetical protein
MEKVQNRAWGESTTTNPKYRKFKTLVLSQKSWRWLIQQDKLSEWSQNNRWDSQLISEVSECITGRDSSDSRLVFYLSNLLPEKKINKHASGFDVTVVWQPEQRSCKFCTQQSHGFTRHVQRGVSGIRRCSSSRAWVWRRSQDSRRDGSWCPSTCSWRSTHRP